jgi:uncharacterized membrane protein HdeD (DUF308 family)
MSQDTPPARADNPQALWALILGVVSVVLTALCGYGLLVGIPAVVLGWRARNRQPCRGMAIIGLVTGALSVAVGTSWLVLVLTGVVSRPDS